MKYLLIFAALLCAGCYPKDDGHRVSEMAFGGELVVYRDKESGCEYIRTVNDRVLMPRMGADGKQICRSGK